MTKAVVGLNGVEMNGRHLQLDSCTRAKAVYSAEKSVFVGNIPFNADEEKLRKHFEDAGKVESVRLIRDSRTQLNKGFGFVSFVEPSSVGLALRLNGQLMKDTKRELRVILNFSLQCKLNFSSSVEKSKMIIIYSR